MMTTTSKCAILVLLFVEIVLAQYNTCDNVATTGTLVSMEVSNCSPNSPPCILKKGRQVVIALTFIPGADTRLLTAKASAVLGAVELPFMSLKPNGCDPQYGINCPLKKGATYTYNNSFPILSWYPEFKKFNTNWLLKDETDTAIVCITVLASINA